MKQKLELTWIGKGDNPRLEPRILLPTATHGDASSGNMLIHGDNLLALKALEQDYAGKVKCIYIDPPYNTGNAFEHYDDGVEHSVWLNLMHARLVLLRSLLSKDGVIFVQIDDAEMAYLKVMMDEVFGRSNFINTVSVNMKNIAGASGGGEDKKLKKNVEYIHVYTKNYVEFSSFKSAYDYIPIHKLVESYREQGKSWKYTSVLVNPGEKNYIGSTVDGAGDEIKIFERLNPVFKSINQLIKEEKLTEKEVYKKYSKDCFQTAMPQSSIRPRVMEKVSDLNHVGDFYSIEYVPRSGKNKGMMYEQFYKGNSFRLLAWLKDVSEIKEGVLCKKELQGTYWDFTGETKNLTKEGSVQFPNGKKPEKLVSRCIKMATKPGDLVLDSFLGSGTTAAVAHKMNRRWIGIELGDHAQTHCVPRLQKVVNGEDAGGITKAVNWQGGGGFTVYELAPTLIVRDEYGIEVINPKYNPAMLAHAMAKHEGFNYAPDAQMYWKQGQSTENAYIYTTTQMLTVEKLDRIHEQMTETESLVICAGAFQTACRTRYPNITLKKIPKAVLGRCEFGKEDYSLNVEEIPGANSIDDAMTPADDAPTQTDLFSQAA